MTNSTDSISTRRNKLFSLYRQIVPAGEFGMRKSEPKLLDDVTARSIQIAAIASLGLSPTYLDR